MNDITVITNPNLILPHEPSGNLHSLQRKELMQLFKRLNEAGATTFQDTHCEKNAAYGNRIIQVRAGWLVEETKAGSREPAAVSYFTARRIR